METIKKIGIFLAILLALFMLVGMWYGALFFFFVLKLMVYAGIIAGVVLVIHRYKKGQKPE